MGPEQRGTRVCRQGGNETGMYEGRKNIRGQSFPPSYPRPLAGRKGKKRGEPTRRDGRKYNARRAVLPFVRQTRSTLQENGNGRMKGKKERGLPSPASETAVVLPLSPLLFVGTRDCH